MQLVHNEGNMGLPVFVNVVWVLVLKKAGLASLCLQWSLEILLTDTD